MNESFWTNVTNRKYNCEPQDSTFLKYYVISPILQILLNLIPLLAIFTRGKRLSKIDSVYVFVKSALCANCLLATMSAYLIFNYIFAFERPHGQKNKTTKEIYRFDQSDSFHQFIMHWYAFRKSFTICLLLVMCNCVAGLTYALKKKLFLANLPQDSVKRTESFRNVVGISGLSKFFASNKSQTDSPKMQRKAYSKRAKAVAFVAVTWSAAVTLSIAGMAKWNCLEHCLCLPAYYLFSNCASEMSHCSRQWMPSSDSFVIAIVTLWIFEVIFISVILFKSVRAFYRNENPAGSATEIIIDVPLDVTPAKIIPRADCTLNFRDSRKLPQWKNNLPFSMRKEGFGSMRRVQKQREIRSVVIEEPRAPDNVNDVVQTSAPFSVARSLAINDQIDVVDRRKARSNTTFSMAPVAPRLSPSLKLVILLSVLVILCTTPAVTFYSLDLYLSERIKPLAIYIDMTVNISISFYCIACPILMVKYLAGLKKALIKMLLKCDITRIQVPKDGS
ncbi:unnamed protein product [Clavelina lepadiformis]|uniref:G-protein coupled receptors family 1 profile domain-containing protein n=1 Tax=Clavelina lepadiformis TaxID=159417 RepID=A0ABP0G4A7_CLALP